MARELDGGLLVAARKKLVEIWNRCLVCGFVGRCYSRRKGHWSPIPGSNITIFDGDKEIVVVWQKDIFGPIQTSTFCRAPAGKLEKEIRKTLGLK